MDDKYNVVSQHFNFLSDNLYKEIACLCFISIYYYFNASRHHNAFIGHIYASLYDKMICIFYLLDFLLTK